MSEFQELINRRINDTLNKTREIQKQSLTYQETFFGKGFYFVFQHSADSPLLSDFERALSVSFITKYDTAFMPDTINVKQGEGENYYLSDIVYYRNLINEFRPVIKNYKDSIHFNNVHIFCRDKLLNREPNVGISVTVFDDNNKDVTTDFLKILNERINSIKYIIKNSDFDYLYNGVLQHSDHKHTERYWDEYVSGKINYVFLEHAFYIAMIKDHLELHYRLINQLTFPKLGPL